MPYDAQKLFIDAGQQNDHKFLCNQTFLHVKLISCHNEICTFKFTLNIEKCDINEIAALV